MVLENEKLATEGQMRKEALIRMEKLGLNNLVFSRFFLKGELKCSDNTKVTDVPEFILSEIKAYQDEFKSLVYHVVHTHFCGMDTYECLTVSPYEEDWDYERPDDKGWTMSHSINLTIPENTESGSIQLVNKLGVLIRVN